MGIIYTKHKLDELYKERERIDEINWYNEKYKDDVYYQKNGVPFEEVHDYSP